MMARPDRRPSENNTQRRGGQARAIATTGEKRAGFMIIVSGARMTSRTLVSGSTDKRLAGTQRADPAPMTMKS
jgi:hypothetical protein